MTSSFNLWSELALFLLAVLSGGIISDQEGKRLNLERSTILKMLFLSMPLATLFGRIYYSVFSYTSVDLASALQAGWGGRIGFYGAAAGCILAVFIVSRMEKLSFPILLDAVVPGAALSMAVMRMTSFFNGFCFGRVIKLEALQFFPFGVYVASIRSWLYAVFVYEAIYCLFLFVLLMLTRKKMKHEGDAAWWLALLYGCGGVLFENMRADSLLIGFVQVSQVVGMVMVLFVLFLFSVRAVRSRGLRLMDFFGWITALASIAVVFLAEVYMGSAAAAKSSASIAVAMALLALISFGYYRNDKGDIRE